MFVTWTLAGDVGFASPAVQVLVTARLRLTGFLDNGPPVTARASARANGSSPLDTQARRG